MAILTKGIRDADYFTYRILAVAERTATGRINCPALEFFREQAHLHRENLTRLQALLTDVARNGPHPGDQKFKRVTGTDGLFEFKVYQLRLFCFWDAGRVIICTTGVVKKQDRSDRVAIRTALEWKAAYLQAKEKGTLQHELGH